MIGLEPRPMLIVSLGVTAIRPRRHQLLDRLQGPSERAPVRVDFSALSRQGRAPLYRLRLLWSSALSGRVSLLPLSMELEYTLSALDGLFCVLCPVRRHMLC